jgi:imidazole glycerol-phosphate synthase subunit HisH
VVVIDYGVGNLLSVQRGLEHCGAKVELTSDPDRIIAAPRVVLPGVGAFGNAMQALQDRGLVAAIRKVAAADTPLLGICLGMQLLLDESEEFGPTRGLGIIPGRVVAIPGKTAGREMLKIPHIGWSELQPADGATWQTSLLADLAPEEAVYFVHSFMAVPADPAFRLADCLYGGHRIPAVIRRGRTFGCQFHPEKSGESGLKILRRFCAD